MLDCFSQHIIHGESNHLILFFDESWHANSATVSFGHDIEAAWLLQECAESITDETRVLQMKEYAVSIANAALEGMDNDGGLFYERAEALIKEKQWRPQAEAMVGVLNAYEISGDAKYSRQSLNSWHFCQNKNKIPGRGGSGSGGTGRLYKADQKPVNKDVSCDRNALFNPMPVTDYERQAFYPGQCKRPVCLKRSIQQVNK